MIQNLFMYLSMQQVFGSEALLHVLLDGHLFCRNPKLTDISTDPMTLSLWRVLKGICVNGVFLKPHYVWFQ